MNLDLKLDPKGLAEILNSAPVDAAVRQVAEETAENVRGMGIGVGDRDGGPREIDLPVTVKRYQTDRPHYVVALAHPAGNAVQAKHGALTKAAGQAGLKVKQKKAK